MPGGAIPQRVLNLANPPSAEDALNHRLIAPSGIHFERLRALSPLRRLDLQNASVVQPAAIGPFLAAGDMMLVVGLKTSGKTTASLDVALGALLPRRHGSAWGGALCVATDWFGPGAKVAIIDGEDSEQRYGSKIRQLLEGSGEWCVENAERLESSIWYVRPSELGLRDKANRERNSHDAAEYLANAGVRLVIGDTAARIWQPTDFNSADWVNEGLAPFHETLKHHGICCLMNAHHKRPGEQGGNAYGPLGSSQQENQADAMVFVHRTSGALQIKHAKSRRSWWIQPDAKIELSLPVGSIGYRLVPAYREAWPLEPLDARSGSEPSGVRSAGLTPQQAKVFEEFNRRPTEPISALELETSLSINKGNVSRICSHLFMSGLIESVEGVPLKSWKLAQ